MAKYRACAFCDGIDSPLTREHVLATWISKEFPGSTWEITALGTSSKPYRAIENLGVVTRKVCEQCNTVWMRDLEDRTKPLLLPMIHGSSVTLAAKDQMLITKWLLKTAMTYDLSNSNWRNSFFEPSERHAFTSSSPMSIDAVAALARYDGPFIGEVATRELHSLPFPNAQQNLVNMYGYGLTILIKHLALQIFALRVKESDGPFKFAIPNWQSATVQIWPIGGIVQWPPKLSLDDKGFEAFATRWDKLQVIV